MGFIDRNALACEAAKEPKCVCACGGAFHGIRHPPEFLAEEYVRVYYDPEKPLDLDLDGGGQMSLTDLLVPGGSMAVYELARKK